MNPYVLFFAGAGLGGFVVHMFSRSGEGQEPVPPAPGPLGGGQPLPIQDAEIVDTYQRGRGGRQSPPVASPVHGAHETPEYQMGRGGRQAYRPQGPPAPPPALPVRGGRSSPPVTPAGLSVVEGPVEVDLAGSVHEVDDGFVMVLDAPASFRVRRSGGDWVSIWAAPGFRISVGEHKIVAHPWGTTSPLQSGELVPVSGLDPSAGMVYPLDLQPDGSFRTPSS
jgi:hypothetical protein